MTKHEQAKNFSRRTLLKAGGALVVSVGSPVTFEAARAADDGIAVATKPPLTPDQLSSYIAVNADGTVSAYSGKMDMGQGLSVAFKQIIAEELDVPYASMKLFIGDTDTSVNQGGASGSTGVQEGGRQMRMAAAEARRVLVEMAAEKLGVPAGQLTVKDGVVSADRDASKKIKLRRPDRRQVLQRASRLERQIRQPALRARQSQAEEPEGLHHRRQTDSARRHRRQGFAQTDFRHGHQSPRHGARPHDPAGGGRRGPGEGRREFDQGHPGREGRLGQRLPRRRRRPEWDAIKASRAAQGRMVGTRARPFPDQTGAVRSHPQGADAQARSGKHTGDVDEAFKTAAR